MSFRKYHHHQVDEALKELHHQADVASQRQYSEDEVSAMIRKREKNEGMKEPPPPPQFECASRSNAYKVDGASCSNLPVRRDSCIARKEREFYYCMVMMMAI